MSRIEAVTFDFWWTLFLDDTDAGTADRLRLDRLQAALAAAGHSVDRDLLHTAIQKHRLYGLELQEKSGDEYPPEAQVRGWLADLGLPAELDAAVYPAYISPYTELMLPVMPDAAAVLKGLAARYRLAVICNTGSTPGSVLRGVLERAGLAPYLSVQTYSNEEGLAKPRPEIFRRTLQRLGAEPGAAVHVGDNGRTDVIGAHACGMRPIWFASHPGAAPPPPEIACPRITRLAELPPLLAQIEGELL